MIEPCVAKSPKQEKHGKEKILSSLKNIIKLVEEECVPDSSCKHYEPDSKEIPCPPDAMVCYRKN